MDQLPADWQGRLDVLLEAGMRRGSASLNHAAGSITWLDCLVPEAVMKVLDPMWNPVVWGLQPCLADGSLPLSSIAAELQDAYHLFLKTAPRPSLYRAFEGDREHGGLKGRCLAYEQALADVAEIRELDACAFLGLELLPMDRVNTEVELVTHRSRRLP